MVRIFGMSLSREWVTRALANLERLVIEEEFPFWAIKDPDGDVIHTFLSSDRQEVIDDFVKSEQTMNLIYNASRIVAGLTTRCAQSWEQWEAEGYSVVRVKVVEAPN